MDDFTTDVLAYCRLAGVALSSFGRRAVGDPGFVARIKLGGQCLPRTVDRVRAFMAANPVASIHSVPDESENAATLANMSAPAATDTQANEVSDAA